MTESNPMAGRSRAERTDQGKEIRDRQSVVEQVIAMLPATVVADTTVMVKGSDSTWVVRGDRGQHLAVFKDRNFAQFTRDAIPHLRAFSTYISQLETEAYQARQRRRREEQLLREITDELQAAHSLGVHTKDGQRRVRQAVQAIYDDRRRVDFDDWDDTPTTRRPPR